MITVDQRCGCCGGRLVDGERHYHRQIQEMQQKLRDEEKAQKNRNSGVCFVTFKSLQLSMRLG